MEITYDTGAKVILQGPVTYEVESAAGGYLSLGKLTARVEKKAEGGSPIPNPQSLIPNPLFAVRTPTATVTDLGTEFGVEVQRDQRKTWSCCKVSASGSSRWARCCRPGADLTGWRSGANRY